MGQGSGRSWRKDRHEPFHKSLLSRTICHQPAKECSKAWHDLASVVVCMSFIGALHAHVLMRPRPLCVAVATMLTVHPSCHSAIWPTQKSCIQRSDSQSDSTIVERLPILSVIGECHCNCVSKYRLWLCFVYYQAAWKHV